MVARCHRYEPVLVFDLDGTILSANSFPRWARRVAWARFPHLDPARRIAISLRVLGMLVTRRFGLISHDTLKWRLQLVWRGAIAGDSGQSEKLLLAELQALVRPQFTALLASVAAGQADAVLATAAAEEYAVGLGQRLGFSHILATPGGRPAPTAGNQGENKRDSVMAFLRQRDWQNRPLNLFTDHLDDLPLIAVSNRVYWFGGAPAAEHIRRTFPHIALHDGLEDAE